MAAEEQLLALKDRLPRALLLGPSHLFAGLIFYALNKSRRERFPVR